MISGLVFRSDRGTRLVGTMSLAPLAAILVAVACGGSQREGRAPEAKADEHESPPSGGREASSQVDDAPATPAPRCADGTCFVCGAGFCPLGFYCDEGIKGGASCSWLPTCSGKSGCGCLSRALSGCKCDDAQGGPHVHCE